MTTKQGSARVDDKLVGVSCSRARKPLDVVLIGLELEENLSIRYLAGACEQGGLVTEILTFQDPRAAAELAAEVLRLDPAVVGISMTFQAYARDLVRLVERLRHDGYRGHVTVGGHFATLASERLLRDVPSLDSIVLHEAEHSFVDLASRVRDEKSWAGIAGLAWRGPDGGVEKTRPGVPAALETLPWPKRATEPARRLEIGCAGIVGSRGCYGTCNYCSIHAWYRASAGPRFRQRSIANVVEELAALHQNGVRIVNFHDDNFFVPSRSKNIARLEELRGTLRRRCLEDMAFIVKCRPSDLDAENLDLLTDIGVLRVYVGIETTSREGLHALGRGVTSEDNERALRLLRERGIFHAFNMLLFDPDTTWESMRPNLDLLEAHPEVPFDFCRAEVYVETPLEGRLAAEGRLRGTYFARSYSLPDPRAEAMFQISSMAFYQRNFSPQGAATENGMLRLDLEILRRFHPYAWDAELHARGMALSRQLGVSSVKHLRNIHCFVSEVHLSDAEKIRDFAVDTGRAVHRDDFAFLTELHQIRHEIHRRVCSPVLHSSARLSPPDRVVCTKECIP